PSLGVATMPVARPEVYLFYFALAVVSFGVAGMLWRANRSRVINQAASAMLLCAAIWLISLGMVNRFPADSVMFIRCALGAFGILWPATIGLMHELLNPSSSFREYLSGTRGFWYFGAVYTALALSPLSIPLDSTWDNPLRGPL